MLGCRGIMSSLSPLTFVCNHLRAARVLPPEHPWEGEHEISSWTLRSFIVWCSLWIAHWLSTHSVAVKALEKQVKKKPFKILKNMCKIKDLTNKKKIIQSDKVMFASFSSSLHVALSHIFLEKSFTHQQLPHCSHSVNVKNRAWKKENCH